MVTRTKFLKQLDDMAALLGRLGDKAASDTRAAGLAAAGDHGAETGILEGRKAAERLRGQIEGLCLDIMLMQQPLVGEDLRFVSASFRIVSDLSQIDSMTRDVAFIFSEMPKGALDGLGERFGSMAERAAGMVERAVAAFCGSDEAAAHAVIDADDELDAAYAQVEEPARAAHGGQVLRADRRQGAARCRLDVLPHPWRAYAYPWRPRHPLRGGVGAKWRHQRLGANP